MVKEGLRAPHNFQDHELPPRRDEIAQESTISVSSWPTSWRREYLDNPRQARLMRALLKGCAGTLHNFADWTETIHLIRGAQHFVRAPTYVTAPEAPRP